MNSIAKRNLDLLKNNPYPGRGIILGMTPDAGHLVQIYWIMGRSENSRNRIFVEENGFVRTKAYEESKVTDPSLIIYYPVKFLHGSHIVSNGDQTDTVAEALMRGESFEAALRSRRFEPDAPNYTPRISGLIDLEDRETAYKLSVIKAVDNNPAYCTWHFFNYSKAIPGTGHCLHTYAGDGNPLPSFEGEPYAVGLYNSLEENAAVYWDLLNPENKVSLLVKFIDPSTGKTQVKIINKYI